MSDRVRRLVDRLTREEKLRLVQGQIDPGGRATGYVPPVERLGIPACTFTDGPMGVRYGRSTAFPASVALAASWDVDLAGRFGRALASEARGKGFDGVLAPGLNVARVPHCGRLFEYFGEDPHLAARFAAATVAAVESRGVLSSPKHYVANNQERARLSVSADVGERALREIYLPPFEAAVEAGAGTVMAAYNRVNGEYAAQHRRLLTDVLKGEFGFEGVVVSDWWAVHDPPAAANAGLDLEMPGATLGDLVTDDAGRLVGPRELARRWPPYLPSDLGELLLALWGSPTEGPGLGRFVGLSSFSGPLARALDAGAVPESRLDDMVRRLLGQYERIGLLDADPGRPGGSVGTAEHADLAREIAVRGTVLLKNDGPLPLDADPGRVALVGPHADRAKVGGGGSSRVTPFRRVSPLAGLRRRIGDDAVEFARGCAPIENPRSVRALLGRLGGGPARKEAVAAAARADVAVVVVGDAAAEGRDRRSLALPGEQDRLVAAVAATDTPTVVVLATSGPVETPWLDAVDAVVEAWYGGGEAGAALAAVLFGDDPGGRLPVTFGRTGDYPATSRAQYPGVRDDDGRPRASYEEGVFVGYRHFDRAGVEPTFPFGHGLSYADFAYRDISVAVRSDAGTDSAVESDSPTGTAGAAAVTVENVGDRRGREVVQAYIGVEDGRLQRPPRELAGFATVALDPGESTRVEVPLGRRAFAAYDEDGAGWVVDADRFEVSVGRSSRDRRLAASVTLD